MRKSLLGLLFISLMIVTISCSKASKDEVLESLLASSSDTYRVNFFFDIYKDEYSQDLTTFWNSDDKLLEVIEAIQVYDVSQENKKEVAKVAGIDEYPYYLITDNQSVVLSTAHFQDMVDFFHEIAGIN